MSYRPTYRDLRDHSTDPWPQGRRTKPDGTYVLTLQDLYEEVGKLQKQLPPAEESAALHNLSRSLKRQKNLWMPLAWIISGVGIVFSAGMGWAMFAGENATDHEVGKEVKSAITSHSTDLTDATHPDIKTTLTVHGEELKQLKTQTRSMDTTLKRLDLRSLYQFEIGRWQAEVIECERDVRCRRPPRKPPKVKELESELMNR